MSGANQQQVIAALKSQFNMVERGDWLRGVCPSCNKKELYTHAKTPVVIRCGRQNKCAYEEKVRDVLPDLFVNFNNTYKPSRQNPKATANAYMELQRGINPQRLHENWKQGTFKNRNADKPTATVRFHISEDVYMERFVETVTITDPDDGSKTKRKQNFKGSHRGKYWIPAGLEIDEGDEVWIVEACINALSLWANGIKAVAALSSANYPSELFSDHGGKDIKWVWAYDNDKAGKKAAVKHHGRLSHAGGEISEAALPPASKNGKDWNDHHTEGDLANNKFIAKCRYYGSLAIAQNAAEKAFLIWRETQSNGFDLVFNNRTYWFNFDHDKYSKISDQEREQGNDPADPDVLKRIATNSSSLIEIANCETTFLYYMANELTDDAWYYARVSFPHGGKPVKNTFTGAQLAAPSEFKKRLLSIAAGAVFTGSKSHLDYISRERLYNLKVVETIDYLGYSKEHQAYILNKLAVKDGVVHELNDEDFFQIGTESIKSLCNSPALQIGEAQAYLREWKKQFWIAFKEKGAICLAYWIGSLFAEQIRTIEKTYPFLELVGEPGSGKSTIIEFLWKLCGRYEYEGFDPMKSTLPARSRNFSQTSNLPVVLIEGDRSDDGAKQKGFDWDELKPLYNGRASRSRGVKNAGNDTYEPPFRGSVIIAQNAEVRASEAMLQRIIHMGFDKSGHTEESGRATKWLEQAPIEAMSYFLLEILQQEKAFLEYFSEWSPKYKDNLLKLDNIRTRRIALNHGQMLALHDLACRVLEVDENQRLAGQQMIEHMAQERERTICQDHPLVQDFWEAYEYLTEKKYSKEVNHSKDDSVIAIHLNHFQTLVGQEKLSLPDPAELKRLLRTSRKPKYIGYKPVRSAIWKTDNGEKIVKCWVFEKEDEKS